jgi:predicted RND superfamily exporter protein
MTSLTTILGMVPMAMGIGEGSEMWQPMGISVVGGLLMSTLLTLFIVPALYAMLQGRKERKAARKAIRQAEEDEFIRMKRLQKIEAERAAKEQNENNN